MPHPTPLCRTTVLAGLLALAPAIGCSGKAEDSAAGTPTSAVVWSGWNHTWDILSHRISLAGTMMNEDGSFESLMVGGDWSHDGLDFPTYRLHATEVTSTGFVVSHGLTELTLGPEGTTTIAESVDVPGINEMDHQIVVLRGFTIDASVEQGPDYPANYDASLGYCSNGFGFGVSAPDVSGTDVSFDVNVAVRWGEAGPEDPIDRSDMNGAIPFAQTGVTVGWTVIGWNGDWSEGSGSATLDQPHTPPYSEQLALSASDLGLSVSGGTPGFPVLTAFDLGVSVPDNASQGEYLRSYGVELSGEGSVEVSTEVTNSSVIETATVRFTPTINAGWIGLSDSSADVSLVTLSGEHDIGAVTIPK